MATTNRNFKVKNGLDVNSNATIDSSGNANLVGATFTGNVAGTNISLSNNVNAVTVNATTFIGSGASLTSIPAANITGTVANGTTNTAASGVGYMGIPQIITNSNVSARLFTSADSGKHFYATTTNVQYTINASAIYPDGTVFTIVNPSAVTSRVNTSGANTVIYLAGVGTESTTGNRTLGPWGIATLLKVAGGSATGGGWIISGNGFTD